MLNISTTLIGSGVWCEYDSIYLSKCSHLLRSVINHLFCKIHISTPTIHKYQMIRAQSNNYLSTQSNSADACGRVLGPTLLCRLKLKMREFFCYKNRRKWILVLNGQSNYSRFASSIICICYRRQVKNMHLGETFKPPSKCTCCTLLHIVAH